MSILNLNRTIARSALDFDFSNEISIPVELYLDHQLIQLRKILISSHGKSHIVDFFSHVNILREIIVNKDIFKISSELVKDRINYYLLKITCDIDFSKKGIISKLNNLSNFLIQFNDTLPFTINNKYQDFITPISHHQISPKLPFELFPYQRNTLYLMNNLVKGNFECQVNNKIGENLYFNKFTKLFNKSPDKITFEIKGGILGDEMGLGKTITAITFCETQDSIQSEINVKNKRTPFQSKGNLILVPSHLGKQWKKEIEKCFPNKSCYTIFTKRDHMKIKTEDLMNADYVIVSYQFLSNFSYYPKYLFRNITPSTFSLEQKINELQYYDFNKLYQESPIIEMIKWNQIFIDEGHEIMENNFGSSAVSETLQSYLNNLIGINYWYVSGTPYNTFYGIENIFKFLKLKFRLEFKSITNKKITKVVDYQSNDNLYKKIYMCPDFMNKIMFRHSKEQVENQINLKGLQKKIHWLTQTNMEKTLYNACKKNRSREYLLQLCCHLLVADTLSSMTMQTVSLDDVKDNLLKNHENIVDTYTKKLHNLNPLNQEYNMLKKNFQNKITQSKFILDTLKKLDDKASQDDLDENECPICIDDIQDPAILSCGHMFCYDCITSFTSGNNKKCPLCKANITSKIVKVESYKQKTNENRDELELKYGVKTGYLIKLVRKLLASQKNKIIIFSQYDFMLKLVSDSLSSNGVSNSFVKGNVHQRTQAIDKFKGIRLGEDENRVIMLSLKNAASGTHLVEANNIIFVEPVDKPKKVVQDIENQAIARAFRIGQKNEVTVHHLFVKDTLEEEIYQKTYHEETI